MVSVRLSGRPFDDMFLDGLPHDGYASASVAQAYVDAVRHYGMDGWYIYGSLAEIVPEDRPRPHRLRRGLHTLVFSHLHVCGRSRAIADMAVNESDVDVIEPLEEPPGGDVDIAEVKRRYSHRVCLKGNINTFEFMLRATPEQVEEKAKRLIDQCTVGGHNL
jgi:hypothetical protein